MDKVSLQFWSLHDLSNTFTLSINLDSVIGMPELYQAGDSKGSGWALTKLSWLWFSITYTRTL